MLWLQISVKSADEEIKKKLVIFNKATTIYTSEVFVEHNLEAVLLDICVRDVGLQL